MVARRGVIKGHSSRCMHQKAINVIRCLRRNRGRASVQQMPPRHRLLSLGLRDLQQPEVPCTGLQALLHTVIGWIHRVACMRGTSRPRASSGRTCRSGRSSKCRCCPRWRPRVGSFSPRSSHRAGRACLGVAAITVTASTTFYSATAELVLPILSRLTVLPPQVLM